MSTRVILGDHFDCRVQCTTSTGAAVAPNACPTITITGPTSPVTSKKIPPQDPTGAPGLFFYRQFLGNNFAVGTYTVSYAWTASAYSGSASETFDVVAGGDGGGQFISAFYLKRPFADFLLGQTDGGLVDRVKNPRF